MAKMVRAVDMFCGAGGTSTGISRACGRLGKRLDLTAINHWDTAIETHAANHAAARHINETLDAIDPRRVVSGRLDLLVASPECTHHSIARGGKPINDQSRATAWHVVRWAEALKPRAILVENVREFQTWGPVGESGRPLKRRRGEIYRAWLNALKAIGYTAEARVLNAADYGDPTTRERLFVLAVRGKGPLPWAEPSHSRDARATLFGGRQRWKPARDIIDWSIKGKSIFNRERPLSPNTMARIEAGLRRFCGAAFSMHTTHQGGDRVGDLARPLATVTGANRGEQALVEPFVMQMSQSGSNGRRIRSSTDPLVTITTADDLAVVEPYMVNLRGTDANQLNGARSVADPVPTVTAGGNHVGLVEPFLVKFHGDKRPGDGARRNRSLDEPVATLDTSNRFGLVDPSFLVKYNATAGDGYGLGDPLDTVTTVDRFALIEVCRRNGIDILFRMLQPHELAAAHSFPADYVFAGNRSERVKQIGNSVPCALAEALCWAMLAV